MRALLQLLFPGWTVEDVKQLLEIRLLPETTECPDREKV